MATADFSSDSSTRDRIAETAAALFAEKGFAGVSMREIADAVGIKAASLYNHFADKETLYQGAIEYGFADRIAAMEAGLNSTGSAEQRLRATVSALAHGSAEDTVSSKLLRRELLDGNAERLKRLSLPIFAGPFKRMAELLQTLRPDANSAFMAACLSALLVGYYDLSPILAYLDDSLPLDPDDVASAIADLMLTSAERPGK